MSQSTTTQSATATLIEDKIRTFFTEKGIPSDQAARAIQVTDYKARSRTSVTMEINKSLLGAKGDKLTKAFIDALALENESNESSFHFSNAKLGYPSAIPDAVATGLNVQLNLHAKSAEDLTKTIESALESAKMVTMGMYLL